MYAAMQHLQHCSALYLQVNAGWRTEEPLLVAVGLLSHLWMKDDDGVDVNGAVA